MNQQFFINVRPLKFYKIYAVNGIKAPGKRLACAWVEECGPARSNMTRLLGTRSWNDWLTAILWPASAAIKGCPMSAAFGGGRETTETLPDQYAAARRLGYEKRADELLEIADDSSADWVDTRNGNRVFDSVHVNRARLMIDTRKWLLSKMLPKVYGDHVTVAGDPDQPIHVVRRIDWASLSDEELEAIEAFALAAQRRLNAAPKVEEQMMLENRPMLQQR
jgi:hypothetical protein